MQKQTFDSISAKFAQMAFHALRFILLNILRAMVVVTAYALKIIIEGLEIALLGLAWLSGKLNVRIVFQPQAESDSAMEAKFTDNEIETMALRLPKGTDTIQSISEYYSISMRQASKVRHALMNRINVNNYVTA